MSSRTRRLIAGTGLAAGLLVGSIAPASALPGEPNDGHCAKIERFEERALDRIDRIESRIDRFETRIERFESRAEARPERADRWERRIERMNAQVDRFENKITKITERYDAIADHCGVDPLFPAPDEPTANEPDPDTPVDNGVDPDAPTDA
jgi:predicted RNase H-like nuclease (RuvC/YqgF family)